MTHSVCVYIYIYIYIHIYIYAHQLSTRKFYHRFLLRLIQNLCNLCKCESMKMTKNHIVWDISLLITTFIKLSKNIHTCDLYMEMSLFCTATHSKSLNMLLLHLICIMLCYSSWSACARSTKIWIGDCSSNHTAQNVIQMCYEVKIKTSFKP